jgi:glycosyltransferase involved in cell wall biosynthesis
MRHTELPSALICHSHLRWDFVFQRPQHLMSRFARERRVFFVEEPLPHDGPARLEIRVAESGVTVVIPRLPPTQIADHAARAKVLAGLYDEMVVQFGIHDHIAWYYTPMAMPETRHLQPSLVVYDCMDELSGFKNAPPELVLREAQLFDRADLVFTGGQRLYEAKRSRHPNVFCFPSAVDAAHFARARAPLPVPQDQKGIPRPRLGYAGVIDERIDLPLLAEVAAAHPKWQLVLVGPVVKIDTGSLPRAANIHYLGMKPYQELPDYLSSWDVALLPFARNDATKFISPTKTPEYLAAGLPVVATSIRDVVRPYGDQGLAHIADEAPDFVRAVEAALTCDRAALHRRAEALLATMSWDRTARSMTEAMADAWSARRGVDSAVAAR